jgi:hypothetical protein
MAGTSPPVTTAPNEDVRTRRYVLFCIAVATAFALAAVATVATGAQRGWWLLLGAVGALVQIPVWLMYQRRVRDS